MDAALREAVRVAGGMRALARLIGTSHQAIAQWARVPAERVPDVERATGISRHRLRPDLYAEEAASQQRLFDQTVGRGVQVQVAPGAGKSPLLASLIEAYRRKEQERPLAM